MHVIDQLRVVNEPLGEREGQRFGNRMVGHTEISGEMIIEGHNDLRGHFLVVSESSPAISFTLEMQ